MAPEIKRQWKTTPKFGFLCSAGATLGMAAVQTFVKGYLGDFWNYLFWLMIVCMPIFGLLWSIINLRWSRRQGNQMEVWLGIAGIVLAPGPWAVFILSLLWGTHH